MTPKASLETLRDVRGAATDRAREQVADAERGVRAAQSVQRAAEQALSEGQARLREAHQQAISCLTPAAMRTGERYVAALRSDVEALRERCTRAASALAQASEQLRARRKSLLDVELQRRAVHGVLERERAAQARRRTNRQEEDAEEAHRARRPPSK